MTYGMEVVAPVEIGVPTNQVQHFNQEKNDKSLKEHLDLLDERRDKAEVQATLSKRRTEWYFSQSVKS